MAANLYIEMLAKMVSQGVPLLVKQGPTTADPRTPLLVAVTGSKHHREGTVADAAAATLYDASADDTPATFDFLGVVADQPCHLQLIDINSTGSNVVLPLIANFPFFLGDGDMLAAAAETAITDASTTLRAIDKVVLGNDSGATLNYNFVVVD